MSKTVTSLFQSEQLATAAASHLKQAGIPRDAIDIWSTPHNLAPLLEDKGVSRSDAHAYVEGVIRGGSVVIVSCGDHHVDQVVSILDHEEVLDLDGSRLPGALREGRNTRPQGWLANLQVPPAQPRLPWPQARISPGLRR